MDLASSSLKISVAIHSLPTSHCKRLFVTSRLPPPPILPRSVLAFARRRTKDPQAITSSSLSKKKKKSLSVKEEKEDDLDGDAFEALFDMLKEDLDNDGVSMDGDDDDISEEDLEKLQRELEKELELEDSDEMDTSSVMGIEDSAEEDVDDEDEEKEEEPVKLKSWQLRRLARALKNGRRKTSIKSLAAELCLDRYLVLEYLRDPPPYLVMMSASLPDHDPAPGLLEPASQSILTPEESTKNAVKSDDKEKMPVHVRQQTYFEKKKLKKVQVETLERVYRRTKRPTNTVISSIVTVINLPRKKVVKWFEDKRTEEGVPDRRLPYQRSFSESVFTS